MGDQPWNDAKGLVDVPATLADIGEFGLIARITALLAEQRPGGVLVGAGDDCAVLSVPRGPLVVTVDMLVEDRDFRCEWSSAREVGRKAMAASLADVAAMGARPWVAVVAFGAPADLAADWAVTCVAGLQAEAQSVGAGVVGGDVSAADRITVAVTLIGDLDGHPPVLRSGARPGDVVAIAGRLGWSAAGLALLEAGQRSVDAVGAAAEVIGAHCCPRPPYVLGPAAAAAGATSMIDVSDGLLADAGHIAESSAVEVHLAGSALVPDAPLLMAAGHLVGGRSAGSVPQAGAERAGSWVLTGGEDHALLATFPSAAVPDGFRVIGRIDEPGSAGPGVWLDDRRITRAGGFRHFTGPAGPADG